MQKTPLTTKVLATMAVLSMVMGPMTAVASDKDKNKGKKPSYAKKWNPAPPKKNGRHDNRNWNKGGVETVDLRSIRVPNMSLDQLSDRRQQTKNEWRNLAIAAGALGVLGLLQNDSRLVFAGAAGALYSAYRYEQDRKSQSKIDRARAYYFSQPSFYRDGKRYVRRTVVKDGKKYYQFVRA